MFEEVCAYMDTHAVYADPALQKSCHSTVIHSMNAIARTFSDRGIPAYIVPCLMLAMPTDDGSPYIFRSKNDVKKLAAGIGGKGPYALTETSGFRLTPPTDPTCLPPALLKYAAKKGKKADDKDRAGVLDDLWNRSKFARPSWSSMSLILFLIVKLIRLGVIRSEPLSFYMEFVNARFWMVI